MARHWQIRLGMTTHTAHTLIALLPVFSLACASVQAPRYADRCAKAAEPVLLQAQRRDAVVRISAGQASGTGFLVRANPDLIFVITNHHVIADASPSELSVHLPGGLAITPTVARVDEDMDLALLALPGSLAVKTLSINEAPPALAQEVMVLGFPGVANSDFTLTTEMGAITATERVVDGRRYIQTNANINPGNSGGPALDACGGVVGVVVAMMRSTERTNLLIPTEHVTRLVDTYFAPPASTEVAVKTTLDTFFQSATYGEPEKASQQVSRGLAERTEPMLLEAMQQVLARVDELYRVYPNLEPEQMVRMLSADEQLALHAALEIHEGRMSTRAAAREMAARLSIQVLGQVEAYDLAGIEERGDQVLVRVALQDRAHRRHHYLFAFTKEAGRLSIDGLRRF